LMADGIWAMVDGHMPSTASAINPLPSAISHQPWRVSLPFTDFVEGARAAADRGADQRALLAAEDSAQACARGGRSANQHRRLRPVAAWRLLHASPARDHALRNGALHKGLRRAIVHILRRRHVVRAIDE